MLNFLSLSIS